MRTLRRMDCEVTTPDAIGQDARRRWREIRRASGSLESPFFAYEFTAMIGASRRDCRVAVLTDDHSIMGFFPFHVGRTRVARPVGRKLADYQGAILDPAVDWDAADLIRLCGLRAYSFDHLVATQAEFRPFFDAIDQSPVLDLADGFDAYLRGQRGTGRGGPQEAQMKRRRLERRFDVRFELHEPDARALQTLLQWKSEQYRRTGVFDTLSRPWVVEVLERAHRTQTDEIAGVLSCLYADDALIAAHLGLRSGQLLHSWFPAYDVRFSKYSPGSVLLLAVAEAGPAHGIRTFDLGKGAEPYKLRFANASVSVGVGSVEAGRGSAVTGRVARGLWSLVLRSPLYTRVHRVRRRLEVG
jgi:CelD/BcsL family acetyltransferase involved in cellulose biosynthesis